MNLYLMLEILAILQCISLSQHSRVYEAKQRLRTGLRSSLGFGHQSSPYHHHRLHHHHHPHPHHYYHHQQRHMRYFGHRNHWSGRRHSMERQFFTGWSPWSACSHECVKQRERYCRVKRKCGYTKHIEERKCWSCNSAPLSTHLHPELPPPPPPPHSQAIFINAAPISTPGHQIQVPVIEEIQPPIRNRTHHRDTGPDQHDIYVFNSRPRHRPRKPLLLDMDAYEELTEEEQYEESAELSELSEVPELRAMSSRNLPVTADYGGGIEGDTFQYEDFDFDFEQDMPRSYNTYGQSIQTDTQYADSYEDNDYTESRNLSWVTPSKERATPDGLTSRHRRLYSKWSRWTKCSPKCTTRRYKKCRVREQCGREVLREIAYCYTEGSFCQQWLQAQVQKTPPYELRPVASRRRDQLESANAGTANGAQSNAIVSDFIMNGKGYRGAEYSPLKLRCGIAPIRSNKRNIYNMLKIIGGKAARKGEWPWQVAIFNRFKEAFCGGTLIAPQWVLTAAHCVRKVLYVRIGEHNLDYEDGTEMQLRILKSFKHPNFDKKTVDSDIALLKLPKPVNASTWIGFSCLPRPYQPLPKNLDCTVIGWGKRRNRDIAGTSVLHQAEVPIIPMENCRSVYHDYTITKNMFCAGHKRGRIDTCAGDSGGPLLCRDTTKPNHPWTIFGITSFGDGCAKRNKFGIYAKVPNYVDWVWSVINCNGNCKLHHRSNGT